MFVPVVTKDMQLFPQQQSARQQRLKNVRSRAQSLEANLQLATHGAATASTNGSALRSSAIKIGASGSSTTTATSDGRNCRSVGALPTSASAACQARSPPKNATFRRPLDPIHEDVAVRSVTISAGCGKTKALAASKSVVPTLSAAKTALTKTQSDCTENQENDSTSSSSSSASASSAKRDIRVIKTKKNNNKSTPDLNALKITERQMQMSVNGLSLATTSSSPGLCKTNAVNAALSAKAAPLNATSSTGSSGRNLVKWLTKTLKGKSSFKDHGATACAKCARLDDSTKHQVTATSADENCATSCTCAETCTTNDGSKTWRSIVPRTSSIVGDEDGQATTLIDAEPGGTTPFGNKSPPKLTSIAEGEVLQTITTTTPKTETTTETS